MKIKSKRRRKRINKKKPSIFQINKKYKLFIILLLLIILLFVINYQYYNKKNKKVNININMKVCVCTLGKNENKYIREFVQHYKNYGIDKIYLYDNNNIDGEKFEDVINDYINNGFVEVLNWRGLKQPLYKIMNDCYQKNYNTYDFLVFYEIDEFIHLHNYTNIKNFLSLAKFNTCEIIHLNLISHTDNNKLYYENKPLAERFPEKIPIKSIGNNLEIKFILRGHIPNIHIDNVHRCNRINKNCNGYGNSNKYNVIFSTEPDYKYYYIDHYYSKSTEEFIFKINNKCAAIYNTIEFVYNRLDKYFSENEITLKKIEMIENGTGLNLSKYRKKYISHKNIIQN